MRRCFLVCRLHDLPCVYNGQLLPAKELEAHGFALTIYASIEVSELLVSELLVSELL